MKKEERGGESFHHGETRSRGFPDLGNWVKQPLRRFMASSLIPCAGGGAELRGRQLPARPCNLPALHHYIVRNLSACPPSPSL